MTTLAAWLVTHDTLVVGCGVAALAAAIYGPHIIDRAVRNHRTRQARTKARAECHANHWRDSSEPLDAWDEPAESTPIHDRLVCEQMERAEGWVS